MLHLNHLNHEIILKELKSTSYKRNKYKTDLILIGGHNLWWSCCNLQLVKNWSTPLCFLLPKSFTFTITLTLALFSTNHVKLTCSNPFFVFGLFFFVLFYTWYISNNTLGVIWYKNQKHFSDENGSS